MNEHPEHFVQRDATISSPFFLHAVHTPKRALSRRSRTTSGHLSAEFARHSARARERLFIQINIHVGGEGHAQARLRFAGRNCRATEIDEYFSAYTGAPVRMQPCRVLARQHSLTASPHAPVLQPPSLSHPSHTSRFRSPALLFSPSYHSISTLPAFSPRPCTSLATAGEYVYSCGYLLVRAISIN